MRSLNLRRYGKQLLLLCVYLFALEISCWAMLSALNAKVLWYGFPVEQLLSSKKYKSSFFLTEEKGELISKPKLVMHPYLGYVKNIRNNNSTATGSMFSLGFTSYMPLQKERSTEKVIIGIFGGSLAMQFYGEGGKTLQNALQSAPAFKGKEIILQNVSIGGYKQPQQLMSLIYIMLQGGVFDIVLNIDGFNEVVLPAQENIPHGVHPLFPRNWWSRSDFHVNDPVKLGFLGRISLLDQRRNLYRHKVRNAPWKYSFTAQFLWHFLDRYLERSILHNRKEIDAIIARSGQNYETSGPLQKYENNDVLMRDLVRIWSESSQLIQNISTTQNMLYIHVLQPNQYVENSKPMGAAERDIAYNEKNPYGLWVKRGYPLLREEGIALSERGVRFHDMTMVFQGTEKPLYKDDCCHFNTEGYKQFARALAPIIIKEYREWQISY